jgi:hypothetical protein
MTLLVLNAHSVTVGKCFASRKIRVRWPENKFAQTHFVSASQTFSDTLKELCYCIPKLNGLKLFDTLEHHSRTSIYCQVASKI